MSQEDLEEARRGRPPGRTSLRKPEDDNAGAPRLSSREKRTFKGAAMKSGGAYIGATHGAALGAAAGAVAGLALGSPLSAIGIKGSRVTLGGAGALAGSVIGTVAGGKYGWKAGSFLHSRTGNERTGTFREHIENIGGESMLINEQVQLAEEAMAIDLSEEAVNDLSEEVDAALVEALLPLAARFDIVDAQLAEGTISEEEAGRQKGGLLKNVAKVGAGLAAAGAAGYGGMKAFQAAKAGNLGAMAQKAAENGAAAVQPLLSKGKEALADAGEVAKQVADKAGAATETAADKLSDAAPQVKQAADDAYETAKTKAGDAATAASDFITKQADKLRKPNLSQPAQVMQDFMKQSGE